MEMIKLSSLEDYENLPVNKWNIKQPPDDEERVSVFDEGKLDLVLSPGLGFTKEGKRLGRGKGYYDGFLTKCRRELQNKPFTLGLAFNEQILPDIPVTERDYIIDEVLFVGEE
ncbi:5-formyltetrahydrofolate cyclo-ligase [Blattella germanica]|nr:5-formyltetrahydrofolate cyclo-ligase [Blattella germanica]